MWKMINKLKGIERKEKDTPLYDDDRAVVEGDEVQEVMMNFRTSIYKKEDKEIE